MMDLMELFLPSAIAAPETAGLKLLDASTAALGRQLDATPTLGKDLLSLREVCDGGRGILFGAVSLLHVLHPTFWTLVCAVHQTSRVGPLEVSSL